MQHKLELLLIAVLSIGFIMLLGHEVKLWGPVDDPGVVYLQDYDCNQRAQYLDKVCKGYTSLVHRIWVDNPSYVEDVLSETDEFVELDSLMYNDWVNTFEFWSNEDSIAYYNNIEKQQIEADLYLRHHREPDELPHAQVR
jgi:hypothetical protein